MVPREKRTEGRIFSGLPIGPFIKKVPLRTIRLLIFEQPSSGYGYEMIADSHGRDYLVTMTCK